MNETGLPDQILLYALSQTHALVACLLGLALTWIFRRKAPAASVWAALAFSVGIFICWLNIFANPMGFFMGYVFVPILRGITYLLLLIGLYVGRTGMSPLVDDFRARPGLKSMFRIMFTSVFLLVFLLSVMITYFLPESYASTARIRVQPDSTDTTPVVGNQPKSPPADFYFIQTEFEVLKSELILDKVIKDLNLKDKWSRKYSLPLTAQETLDILIKTLDLRPVRNTSIIEIRYYSEDKKEAADIANAIADTYEKYRVEQRRRLISSGIDALTNRLAEVERQIVKAQRQVDDLRRSLKTPEAAGGENVSATEGQGAPYLQAKRELEQQQRFHELLYMKVASEITDQQLPKASMVEIVDHATEGLKPVRPNKTLIIVVGLWLGFFLALAAAGGTTLAALVWRSEEDTEEEEDENADFVHD